MVKGKKAAKVEAPALPVEHQEPAQDPLVGQRFIVDSHAQGQWLRVSPKPLTFDVTSVDGRYVRGNDANGKELSSRSKYQLKKMDAAKLKKMQELFGKIKPMVEEYETLHSQLEPAFEEPPYECEDEDDEHEDD